MPIETLIGLYKGTRFTVTNRVTQKDGTPVTNATLTATVTFGDDTVLAPAPTVVNDGGGDYHIDVTGTVTGVLTVTWKSTAPVIVANEARVLIKETRA